MLSFKLRNFKRKGGYNWNFSCPVCGDSKTNSRKARGYIYQNKGNLLYHCHNCGVTMNIPRLIKFLDAPLYDEYVREKLVAANTDSRSMTVDPMQAFVEKMKPPKFAKDTPLKHLKKISQFSADSAVKQWVEKRMIPTNYHYKLYFCKEFKKWVNTYCIENKFPPDSDGNLRDEPRLIIPFIDKEGNLFGFQGRSFQMNAKIRYITIILDESKPKLFGLDTVDTDKHIYVVEGPIDSMFLPNCIASCGSDLISNLNHISEDLSKFTIVFDNEPRNKEIAKHIEKAINKGYSVCLWPETVKEKDINDMYKAGYSQQKLLDIIKCNTYTGLEAKLKLTQWKKVSV
jgi:transcription elongation factor Elf1